MTSKTLCVLALAMLAGCSKQPIAVSQTENSEIRLEKLFTHDGCTIYRFTDDRYVYWADCRGRVSSSHTESCGKNCTRTIYDEVETND